MDNKTFLKLPESEFEIMQGIWALRAEGEPYISAGVIMKRFPALNRLKLTTVLTLINRLQMKSFVSTQKKGRANCYTPLVDETEYKNFLAVDFVDRVFCGNCASCITAIASGKELDEATRTALNAWIAEAEAEK